MGYELADHTSEIILRLRAPTYGALVAEATRAFVELVPASLRGPSDDVLREFRIAGVDRVATLIEWLNELVYLSEAEQWLPTEVEVSVEDDAALVIRARGEALRDPFVLVKAATLHRASVEETAAGLVAEVTLDV